MVPRLIHHLLRLCAIIVSIVCSSVLTVCAPFHLFCFFCSRSFTVTVLSFSFSVCRRFVYFNLCVNLPSVRPRGHHAYIYIYMCMHVPGLNVSSRRHTGVPSRLKYSKTEYIYMQLYITRAVRYAAASEWDRSFM